MTGETLPPPPYEQRKRDFGQRILNLRKGRGWTQAELAQELKEAGYEVTGATVSGWENGKWVPRMVEEVERIEFALDAEGELTGILGYKRLTPAALRLDDVEEWLASVEMRTWVLERKFTRGADDYRSSRYLLDWFGRAPHQAFERMLERAVQMARFFRFTINVEPPPPSPSVEGLDTAAEDLVEAARKVKRPARRRELE